MISPLLPAHPQPRFSALSDPQTYNGEYTSRARSFGTAPDRFILHTLQENFPDASATRVWDIGCGMGRNSLPIAKLGYQVTGSELSDVGRNKIERKLIGEEYRPRVTLDDTDVLKPGKPVPAQRHHFALMSHVSQHFKVPELGVALRNVYERLAPGGLFVFDALVRKPGNETLPVELRDTDLGCTHFSRADIADCVRKAGFRVEAETPYAEKGASRPRYVDSPSWGGATTKYAKPQPLSLQWFVLKKPATER